MNTSTTVGHGTTTAAFDSVGGWRFSCHKAPAMSSAQREELAAELRLRPAIPLPEVVFADNTLQIDHPATGFRIRFDAKEALHTWMQDHKEDAEQWEPSSFDFTYSTSYIGSVSQEGRPVKITPTSETLPLDKLQQQVAILFYDRVLLFEDDIRDLGEIYVEIRVRVMDFGFLLLCRYYCRIDEKQTLKLQDARYYHEFGDDFVWRDHELRESTIDDIKQALSTKKHEHHDAHVELSGDAVYGVLRPISTATEKIYLNASS
ncbi:TOR signaling pathway protein TipA [Phytophthora palmivora]|uniref:TOR signaling pathway protein TipA n=1 Tax=Phytophthora palmivora TaxID=4796 RepID=A0A2P4X7R3_9STRA|nr:TOR signaling pathway protein TipA [Phytophthora palmivora]